MINTLHKKALNIVTSEKEKLLLKEFIKLLREDYKNNLLKIRNDKIKIDYDFLIKMSKKGIFKKNSFETHKLIKKLKKERLIDSKSKVYPKNIKFFSANPLHNVFLDINLNKVEKILQIRDELLKNINSFNDDIELYIYLRLFSLNRIKPKYILQIDRNSFFSLNDKLSILVILDKQGKYTHIEIFFLDNYLSKIFKDAYKQKIENIFDAIDHIFEKNLDFYEKEKEDFLKKNNLKLTDCYKAVDFEYMLNNSPLELTLKNYSLHPKITLKELDYLFPNRLPKELIKIEEKNYNMFYNLIDDEKEILSAEDKDIDELLVKPFEILEELKKISINNKKDITFFLDKKYKFIERHLKKDKFFDQILVYIREELFKRADKRFTDDPIKIKTLREYINVLFNYCFNILLKYEEINEIVVLEIDQILENSNFTEKTKKKYKEIINRFFVKYSEFSFESSSIIDIRRSIVFEDEFNQFINMVLKKDKRRFENENYKMVKRLMRATFAILLYNSGLRKNELRSRLERDIIKIGENEYIIYVDNEGFKKAEKFGNKFQFSLKTKNAKRKVRIKIKNEKYNQIVSKYYEWITKNNFTFFFPLITEKRLLKKRVAKESFFNELSDFLKNVTKRHAPLHSLRHSFATFYLFNKLKNRKHEKFLMFELSNIMGHADIQTTLKNYLHLDVIKVLLSLKNDKVL